MCCWWANSANGGRSLKTLEDPVTGPSLSQFEEVAGICFYTPRPETTSLRLEGRDLPVQIYPADHTGQVSVGLAPAPPPRLDIPEET